MFGRKSKKQRAKEKYLKSPEGRAARTVLENRDLSADQLSDTVLPDDFEFDGLKVLGGQTYKTAGEYKEAVRKAELSDPAYIYTPGDQS